MRLHVLIRGRVQGVGFRWFVRETAEQLGLAGWVKNRPDGDVETEAEGEADSIEKFRAALKHGPRGARVDDVSELEPGSDSLSDTFAILRHGDGRR